MTLRDNIYKF